MNKAGSQSWYSAIDWAHPCWQDYHVNLKRLFDTQRTSFSMPDVSSLQSLVCNAVKNFKGRPICFTPADQICNSYEEEIFNTGRVSTRTDNWHDLFNALVWSKFPNIKATINALHYRELKKHTGPERGKLRDALTLWDECGVIVVSDSFLVLEQLSMHDWHQAFCVSRDEWRSGVKVFVCGHALLEKFLEPYKAITAHALLVKTESTCTNRDTVLASLDHKLALKLFDGEIIQSSADLSPLPLAGIPGWWAPCEQNDTFYEDTQVFRRPGSAIRVAPIFKLRAEPFTNSERYEMTY